MHHGRVAHAFLSFHLTLGLVVLVDSLTTFGMAAGIIGDQQHNAHLALLAGVESAAALLFLIRSTLRVGAYVLLAVFAIAILAHAAQGEFAAHLLLYIAGTVLVLIHGPVSVSRLYSSETAV